MGAPVFVGGWHAPCYGLLPMKYLLAILAGIALIIFGVVGGLFETCRALFT